MNRLHHHAIALVLGAGVIAGCELIAAVDRNAIPPGAGGSAAGGGGAGGVAGMGGGPDLCADGTQNGNETDVDCGGDTCPPCANGALCNGAADCQSTFCTDGVCCDAACDQACDSCTAGLKGAGNDGECGPTAAMTICGDVASCSMGIQLNDDLCDGMSAMCIDGGTVDCMGYQCNGIVCGTSCASDTECLDTHFCDMMGACMADMPNGQSCMSDAQCVSGFCVDGVCCDAACGGTCEACNLAASMGTCTPYTAGTDPEAECSPYTCATGACKTMCTVTADCAMDHYCSLVGNACLPKKQSGMTCTLSVECVSGFCVDGVCCNSACSTVCNACNIAGSLGTCGQLMQGTVDPACMAPNTTCNDMGQCKLPGGVTCTNDADCASGSCLAGIPKTCAP